jgi:hypothetical protein
MEKAETINRFSWRNLIEISDEWGEKERKLLEAELDKLEPLHLMQETLRDIPSARIKDSQPEKITIKPHSTQWGFSEYARVINLPPDLKTNGGYLDKNNNEHKWSLTRILLHELQHGVDYAVRDLARGNISRWSKVLETSEDEIFKIMVEWHAGNIDYLKQIPEKLSSDLTVLNEKAKELKNYYEEQFVASRINQVMKQFFNEEPKAYYFSLGETQYPEKYLMESAKPTALYDINPELEVKQPIQEVCRDIAEQNRLRSNEPRYTELLKKHKTLTQKYYPEGSLQL